VARHGIRFLAAASLLGVALLMASPGGAVATPGRVTGPSAFGSHHLVKTGSFSELVEAVDSNGKIHIAAGDENDIWYLTNRTGSWTAKRVFVHTVGANGYLWGMPTIALDANDRVHIAAQRFPFGEGGIGVFYVTDVGHARGSFGTPARIASNSEGEPRLQVYNGHLYLVVVKNWCCVGDGSVMMRTNKTGRWTQAYIGAGQNPSFQMTSDGYARVVYERSDAGPGLYYAKAGTHKGSFTTSPSRARQQTTVVRCSP